MERFKSLLPQRQFKRQLVSRRFGLQEASRKGLYSEGEFLAASPGGDCRTTNVNFGQAKSKRRRVQSPAPVENTPVG